MARVIYSERQSLSQVIWVWCIIIPIFLLAIGVVLYGFYQQIILGKPWGNQPMSDGGLIAVTAIIVILPGIIFGLLSSITLSIEITSDEFRYKFFSFFTRWHILSRPQIADYSVEKYSFLKARGLGYRINLFSKTERMIIKPAFILTLHITDGKTIMVSTGNKEELERAMKKLMSDSENF